MTQYNVKHDTENYKNYYALLLDVQGQKNALNEIDKIVQLDVTLEEKERLQKKLKPTNAFIDSIYDTCNSIIDIFHTKCLDFSNSFNDNRSLSDFEKEMLRRVLRPNITHTQFSDTYVLSFPMSFHDEQFSSSPKEDQYTYSSINILFNLFIVLDLASRVMIGSLLNHLPVRGGIATGSGIITKHTNTLYGKVLANAYYLENSVAQYPRYVVSKEIIEQVDAISKSLQESVHKRLIDYLTTRINELFFLDDDGLYVVNFIQLFSTQKKGYEYLITSYNIVIENVKKYKAKNDVKLLAKYSRLRTFFINRVEAIFYIEYETSSERISKLKKKHN